MKLVELDPAALLRAQVVVAGYTGRDLGQVQHHIDELARIGVAPPANVPEFYLMPEGALTYGPDIVVTGESTSGEVEPVLVRLNGQLYLTVGSDHTDRAREASEGVAESKACCPKPMARHALALSADELECAWDHIELSSSVDGGLYQQGYGSTLRPLTEILATFDERGTTDNTELVLFGGTMPLLSGEFRYGESWTVSLAVGGHRLTLSYHTRMRARKD